MKRIVHLFAILLFVSVPVFSAGTPLPVDPSIQVVTLENGLTCWLKQHSTPAGRVDMWLRVHAGSLEEEENQRGLAHFLEHMAFKGSDNFPPGELLSFFESIGMRFGQHQNAFTSFDQTTYQMSLPNVTEETLGKGLMCLADYAFRLHLLPEEIDKERKVILEEFRARDGLQKRLSEKTLPVYLPGSRLVERLPVGKTEVVEAADREALHLFYRTWYHPANSTLLVVGDVTPERLLPLIRKQFGAWPATEELPKPAAPGITSYQATRSAIVSDPEQEEAELLMASVWQASSPPTTERHEKTLIDALGTWMLRRRLNNLIREGKAPFQSAGTSKYHMFKEAYMASVSVSGEPGRSREMLAAMARETHRARLFGFQETELAQAREAFQSQLREAVKTESTRNAAAIIRELNAAAGKRQVPMSAQQELDLTMPMLERIDLDQVNLTFQANFPVEARLLMGILPETAELTEQELREIVMAVEAEVLEPPQEAAGINQLMASIPEPAAVLERSHDDQLGVTSLTLANGTRVHIRPMDYKENRVFVSLSLTGGLIQESEANRGVTEAAVLALNQAATQDLNSTQIRDFMTPKNVGVSGGVSEDRVILSINGSPDDLEHGFQLVHLLLTRPRLEPAAFNNWVTQKNLQYKAMQTLAEGRLFEELPKMLTSDIRLHTLTPDQINALTLEQAQAWLERLIREGTLELAITGDLPEERARTLAQTYIGTLPPRLGEQNLEPLRQLAVSAAAVEKSITIPSIARRSAVFIGWRVPGWEQREIGQKMNLARLILEKRIRKEIREERGWTYSSAMIYRASNAFIDSSFFGCFFTADPDKAVEATELARKIIQDFAETGPTAEEMQVAQLQLDTMLEVNMREPAFWSSRLCELGTSNVDLDYYRNIRESYGKWTAADVRAVMQEWIVEARRLQILALVQEKPTE